LPSHQGPRAATGRLWWHEIKHDGFRLMVRRDPAGVRLLTRNGLDWSTRWLKFKNPAAPAVKREAEEDWGKERWR
jgi:ATP-dependent DNA ligase